MGGHAVVRGEASGRQMPETSRKLFSPRRAVAPFPASGERLWSLDWFGRARPGGAGQAPGPPSSKTCLAPKVVQTHRPRSPRISRFAGRPTRETLSGDFPLPAGCGPRRTLEPLVRGPRPAEGVPAAGPTACGLLPAARRAARCNAVIAHPPPSGNACSTSCRPSRHARSGGAPPGTSCSAPSTSAVWSA